MALLPYVRRLCLVAGALASAVLGSALTVAAYNVENYLVADRQVDGVYRQAYPKPEKEKAAVRRVITSVAPDILAVEEMGRQPFLDELQRDLKKEGQDYPYTVVLEAADADRHVALLSKLPLKDVQKHSAVPVAFLGQKEVVKRGVLEVTVATAAGDLTIFVLHLKSRRTEMKEDPEGAAQRLAEAEAVRDLVLTRFPDPAKAQFIICGDWNDTRMSKPVRALDKRGKTDVGEILRGYDSHGETWTHFYRREDTYSRIDYILVSPGLKPLVEGGRSSIFDGPDALEGSDHRLISVRLRTDPAQQL